MLDGSTPGPLTHQDQLLDTHSARTSCRPRDTVICWECLLDILQAEAESARLADMAQKLAAKEDDFAKLERQLSGQVKELQQQLLDARTLQPWTPKAHEVWSSSLSGQGATGPGKLAGLPRCQVAFCRGLHLGYALKYCKTFDFAGGAPIRPSAMPGGWSVPAGFFLGCHTLCLGHSN